jgi:prepilin-type N-terminal cleavage/methylation domain-containing protein
MRFIRRLREERGMTMIELMVAATICAVGTMATIGVIDHSRSLGVKSEKRDAMAHQAEREMERLLELPWDNLAHSDEPVPSAEEGNPASYVQGTNYAYDRQNPGAVEPLVVSEANGEVPPESDEWTDEQTRISGRVYRYVTQVDSDGLGTNTRRITVVVTVGGVEKPADVLLSSIKTIPVL